MQVGMVGLGRMGANLVRRLMKGGHDCVVYDLDPANVRALVSEGATGAESLDELVSRLDLPRVVWVMVPAGDATETTITGLGERLAVGDTVVDGGNSHYKDDIRRCDALNGNGIGYVDVGTSGGVWGAERGYCLMVGGAAAAVEPLTPILKTLAPGSGSQPPTPGRTAAGTADQGYLHCGPVGAGHFVKMVHNGIEYGLMQAYAEGFDILRAAGGGQRAEALRYQLDLGEVAELWRRGSVIGSWLLDLTATALAQDPDLAGYVGTVSDSGEGRWTVQAALEEGVPANVLSAALYTRFRSQQPWSFAEKMLSAMRHKFGGHIEPPAEP